MASTEDTAPGTRDRLVAAMADALQRRGLHGVGLSELLAQAQAPKGVLYHHFPGGKTALAVAAVEATVARMVTALDRLITTQSEPVAALRAWMAGAQKVLARGAFERGCPLATVALESTAEDTALRLALAAGFETLRARLAAMLRGAGLPEAKARMLSTLIIAAYEGALMQARVAGSAQPMDDTAEALIGLVHMELVRAQLAAAQHPAQPRKATRR